jgi:hypothetical protein
MAKRRVYIPPNHAITVRPRPFRQDKVRRTREMEQVIREGIKKIEKIEKDK